MSKGLVNTYGLMITDGKRIAPDGVFTLYPCYRGSPAIERLGDKLEMQDHKALFETVNMFDVVYRLVPLPMYLDAETYRLYQYLNHGESRA